MYVKTNVHKYMEHKDNLLHSIDNQKIIDYVLKSPDILWSLLSAEPKVLGPWVAANDRKQYPQHRSTVDSKQVFAIYKSQKLEEPKDVDFLEEYPSTLDGEHHIDYESYNDAVEEYNEELKIWDEWRWYLHIFPRANGYAPTMELAKKQADAYAIKLGYLLKNGD